jgi:hypothetical protein
MPSPSAETRPLSGSPVPAQTTPFGSTATAPIACTVSLGHTDANVCPESVLFQIPPAAAAAYT